MLYGVQGVYNGTVWLDRVRNLYGTRDIQWNGLVIVCVSVRHKGYTMERPGYSLCVCRAQGVYCGTAWL